MLVPEFDENALAVLRERYLWRCADGNELETPQEMLRRVAGVISLAESEADRDSWAEKFYTVMALLDFLPNSPTLMNAGRLNGQLSACYVLGIEDSMESIFTALKHQALIHKSGGGTGFNFSNLRPEGAHVASTNGTASGPVSFMGMFNHATDVVQQGGMRRGANMGILNVDHPDVLKFIRAKTKDGTLSNFNISVGVYDSFMESLDSDPNASALFDALVDAAWSTGDPGLVFLDGINNDNPTPWLGRLTATNPCGETPLYPNEACNLGSINLAHMVALGHEGRLVVDYDRIRRTVETAVRFLDNVITVNCYPLPEIRTAVLRTRKIGLGVMGWAEMLFQLRIAYDSCEAVTLAETVMQFISVIAGATSSRLALERGAFKEGASYRNATRTCIAPTGTLSLLAGCSSGIEPLFALRHTRVAFAAEDGHQQTLEYYNCYYQNALADPSWTKEDIKRVFVTSHEIAPKWHVLHQAAFQRYTDLAVSKTINLPHSATRDDVKEAFLLAWVKGCKGVTVYRDGCKTKQVLYASEPEKSGETCPVCGASVKHVDGCTSCTKCAWGACAL